MQWGAHLARKNKLRNYFSWYFILWRKLDTKLAVFTYAVRTYWGNKCLLNKMWECQEHVQAWIWSNRWKHIREVSKLNRYLGISRFIQTPGTYLLWTLVHIYLERWGSQCNRLLMFVRKFYERTSIVVIGFCYLKTCSTLYLYISNPDWIHPDLQLNYTKLNAKMS